MKAIESHLKRLYHKQDLTPEIITYQIEGSFNKCSYEMKILIENTVFSSSKEPYFLNQWMRFDTNGIFDQLESPLLAHMDKDDDGSGDNRYFMYACM